MSDRLAVLRDGRLMQVGTPSEVYSRPANAYVAGFLGTANMYNAVVTSVEGRRASCRVGELDLTIDACTLAVPGAEVSLVIRPERIEVCAATDADAAGGDNLLPGRVEHLVFRGAQTQVTVRVAGCPMVSDVANVHGDVPEWLHEGREVRVRISPQAARLLPRDGEDSPSGLRPHDPALSAERTDAVVDRG